MLTTVTTVGGLTPIMLEKSFQAQFLIPMAASIAFGEIFATVLVLYLVPVLYSFYGSVTSTRPLGPEPDEFDDMGHPQSLPQQEPSFELDAALSQETADVPS